MAPIGVRLDLPDTFNMFPERTAGGTRPVSTRFILTALKPVGKLKDPDTMENNNSIINTTCIEGIVSRRNYVLRCLDHVVAQLETRDEVLSVNWGTGELIGCDAAQVAEMRSRLAADDAFWADFLPANAHVTPLAVAKAVPLAMTRMLAPASPPVPAELLLPVDRVVLSLDPTRQRTLMQRLVCNKWLFQGDLLLYTHAEAARELPPSCRDPVVAAMAPYADSGLSWPAPCEHVKGWLDAWVKSARPSIPALRRIRLSDTPLSNRTRNVLSGVSWRHKSPGTARSDINDLAALVLDDRWLPPELGEKGKREIWTFLGGIGLWRGMWEKDFPVEAGEQEAAAQSAAEPSLRDTLAAMVVTREDAVRGALEAFLNDPETINVAYANGDVLPLATKDIAKHALRDVPACMAVLAHPAPLTPELVRRYLVVTAHGLAAECGGTERALAFDPRLLLPVAALGLPEWLETLLLEDETVVVGDLVYKLSYINLPGCGFHDATDEDNLALCQNKLQDLLGAALDARALERAGWPITYQSRWTHSGFEIDCDDGFAF